MIILIIFLIIFRFHLLFGFYGCFSVIIRNFYKQMNAKFLLSAQSSKASKVAVFRHQISPVPGFNKLTAICFMFQKLFLYSFYKDQEFITLLFESMNSSQYSQGVLGQHEIVIKQKKKKTYQEIPFLVLLFVQLQGFQFADS